MPQNHPGRPAWKEVDLAALRYNVALIRRHVAPALLMAAIKADAYGHGAAPVARTVLTAGAVSLAVATVEEAIELRESGITAPILILGWIAPEQIEQALRFDVQFTIFDYENAAYISAMAVRNAKSAAIHIKVDTGLARLGFSFSLADIEDIKRVYTLPGLHVEGVFSHFAAADAMDPGYTEEQIRRYHAFLATLQAAGLPVPLRHLANSPGTLDIPASYLDMVRPGLILFGCYPAEHMRALLPLKLVMRVAARIAQIHKLQTGDYVGYGCRWQARRESRIATLPLGYADGVPRLVGNKADVLIHGQRARMVGSVCMDQVMADVTDIPAAQTGDEAVIVGQQGGEMITPEELAAHAQTISDEICTRFGQRLPRVYLNDHQAFI
ncbi:MAG: alanine racemase [Clostridiales bacterium]|nr:alanine racemase [Clostridiales bacterium]